VDRREKERQKHQYASAKDRAEKHDRGFEPTAITLPEGVKMFRFRKEGTYRLDILPYRVGKGNPFADEGFLHYERTYFTHAIPTPDGSNRYCCLKKTFHEDCPVCEYLDKARREKTLDQKSIKELGWKERQLFNLRDLDNTADGIQIFEFNWFQFGKTLDVKSKNKERYATFYALEDGFTVEVVVEEESYQGRPVLKPVDITFESREDYPESTLEETHCLDDLPKYLSYDELKALLEGGKVISKKEEKEEAPPSHSDSNGNGSAKSITPTIPPQKFKEGQIVTHPKLGECEVKRISGDGKALVLEDQDKNVHRAINPVECTLVITREMARPSIKPVVKDEEDDDFPALPTHSKASGSVLAKKGMEEEDDDFLDVPPKKKK